MKPADKALEFLKSLDEDKILEVAQEAGMPELPYLERLIIRRCKLVKEFRVAQEDFNHTYKSLTESIEQRCQHDWTEPELICDNSTKWSDVKLVATYRRKCKVCEKLDIFTKTSDL